MHSDPAKSRTILKTMAIVGIAAFLVAMLIR
jgi:hypothetical protein